MIRVSELRRPEPLVPRWRIHGIDERIDAHGAIVTPLDEAGVARAADALAADGSEAIAIVLPVVVPRARRRSAGPLRSCASDIQGCGCRSRPRWLRSSASTSGPPRPS